MTRQRCIHGSSDGHGRTILAAGVVAASILALTVLAHCRPALAADKLLVAFHLDLDMGTFFMSDDRDLGDDIEAGPVNYYTPWFNVWFTGGVVVRLHPFVALDLQSGIAGWTGRGRELNSWSLIDPVFKVENRFVPLELVLAVSVLEAPGASLAITIGPGYYAVFRTIRGPDDTHSHSTGNGVGGKLGLLVALSRKGSFEFDIELGFRLARVVEMKSKDGVDTGDIKPDFSGFFLSLRLLFGGGSVDPHSSGNKQAAPDGQQAAPPGQAPVYGVPAYEPAPQQPQPMPPAQVAPLPPGSAPPG